jgi:hypothetical protein
MILILLGKIISNQAKEIFLAKHGLEEALLSHAIS